MKEEPGAFDANKQFYSENPKLAMDLIWDKMADVKPMKHLSVGSRLALGPFVFIHIREFLAQLHERDVTHPEFQKFVIEFKGISGVGKSHHLKLVRQFLEHTVGQIRNPGKEPQIGDQLQEFIKYDVLTYEKHGLEASDQRDIPVDQRDYQKINKALQQNALRLLSDNDLLLFELSGDTAAYVGDKLLGVDRTTSFSKLLEEKQGEFSKHNYRVIKVYLEGGPTLLEYMPLFRHKMKRTQTKEEGSEVAYAFGKIKEGEILAQKEWEDMKDDGASLKTIQSARRDAENLMADLAVSGELKLPFPPFQKMVFSDRVQFLDQVIYPLLDPNDTDYEEKRLYRHLAVGQFFQKIANESMRSSILSNHDIFIGLNDPSEEVLGIHKEALLEFQRKVTLK